MAYVLVVRMTAREGNEGRAAELIDELVAATRQEPGNLQYIPLRDADDPRTFAIYEEYADEAAFKAHGESEHFQRLGAGELFGLMEERRREIYKKID
jgi:quinol monooxygenase YgiN